MIAIDRKKFFDGYREEFGSLKQGQVDGLSFLLDSLEKDEHVDSVPWASYMLATTKHETAGTFRPIEEYGRGKGKRYGIPHAKTGKVYSGKGFVQLTWYQNYLIMGNLLGIDLVNHPELALEPATAYRIMSLGMRKGLFTGKKLSDYLNDNTKDYVKARKIINGLDCCDKIAQYAIKFERIILSARVGSEID